jgi:carboxypeptidase Q
LRGHAPPPPDRRRRPLIARRLRSPIGAVAPIAETYREVASRILDAAARDQGAWTKLAELCDRIGARPSGSHELEQAVAWAVATLERDGHEHVRAEPAMVPHWIRGEESGELVAPIRRPLRLLALGTSAGTRRGGLTADVVAVASLEELERIGPSVKGKIVLFTHALATGPDGDPLYGAASAVRRNGPRRAAQLGAVAAMVRSITTRSLRTPHTGNTSFEEVPPIPAVALAVEDVLLLERLLRAGERVRVRLALGARTLPRAAAANVVAELVGRERPDEVVVIGGHLDSWDVGQGAHDDGGGVVTAMQALTLLRQLGLQPRRTIRVVLWTAEENGIHGARAYAAAHAEELGRHVLAIEMDSGVFAPRGFSIEAEAKVALPAREPDAIVLVKREALVEADRRRALAVAQIADILTLLEPVGATRAVAGHSGADISPLLGAGVIGAGLDVDPARYFDYHHTEADTLDKVDPKDLARTVAAMAVLAYVVADMPPRLGTGSDR